MRNEKSYANEESRFDAFCKAIIRNEAKDAFREETRRAAKEISYDCVIPIEAYGGHQEDTYNTYERTYYVGDIAVAVHDEGLGDVLEFVVPARRNVILLSFILGYSDTEISKTLNISNSTVAYRRKAALKRIKELMEARKNGN